MKSTMEFLHELTDELLESQVSNPRDSRVIFDILAKHIVHIIRERNNLISFIKGTIINNTANFIKGYEENEEKLCVILHQKKKN